MRQIVTLLLISLLPLCLSAQEEFEVLHGDCLPTGLPQQSYALHIPTSQRRLPAIINEWDASKTYHQLVILVEFVDEDFRQEDPKTLYDRILNEPGYNQRVGAGCMADYFREQSNGLLNLQFDVYGPYKVSQKAQPYENPTSSTRNYGSASFREATELFLTENPDLDFTQYDWNDNGSVNQVVYVYAGMGANVSNSSIGIFPYGRIWPNTSSFSTLLTHDNIKISNYSASAEVWPYTEDVSCGFGTICHEYAHSLGLPDIYPTVKAEGLPSSVCDEWDLMDGGNFTNYGWCPPSLTSLERMLLGWLTPIELDEPTSITNMAAFSQGGEAYQICHSDNEYLLLENRQHTGWDAGTPGHGLLVWYVNYNESAWRGNSVNNVVGAPRFHPIYADGMDYAAWVKMIKDYGLSSYQNKYRMNKRHLSTAPYPYVTETDVVDEIVDEYITNIRESDDGIVAFDFMGGTVGVKEVTRLKEKDAVEYYDLSGRRIVSPLPDHLYIIKTSDGSRKLLY